ncbi:hypothetical protein M405DRAFT_790359 [Rhizopogon salebrosus TDB-379]|nr:hypothetical protein M405DRAFT_790359 [Rhizopogon salebrosus TDB-379]
MRVKRVIFGDNHAVGVEFTSDLVSASDTDLSLITVRASKLLSSLMGVRFLERSGIGAEAIPKRCGIKQLVNLPGVGESYRDHQVAFASYHVAENVVTMNPIWRRDESAIQECLAQWNSDCKGLDPHRSKILK